MLPDVDVERILDRIRNRKAYLLDLTIQQRTEEGIHGKQFFREVIARALDKVDRQRKADEWRERVARVWGGRWHIRMDTLARALVA